MLNFLLFLFSLFLVTQSANFAIRSSARLAEGLRVPKYIIGFLLVAMISVLPETFISIASAIQNKPSFGLGTLFGSNVADLSLIFAIIIFMSARDIKVESKIIKNNTFYLLAMVTPIIFGLDGHYSRMEGIILILVGLTFYFLIFIKSGRASSNKKRSFSPKQLIILLGCMAVLLLASNITVMTGVAMANSLGVNPVLVAMLVVALGTTLPELTFSVKAIKDNHQGMGIGDMLGTVLTDATIIVGILAVIKPFSFNYHLIYVTGIFMFIAAAVLLRFMHTGRVLTKKEGLFLLCFYLIFVLTEFFVGNYLTNGS